MLEKSGHWKTEYRTKITFINMIFSFLFILFGNIINTLFLFCFVLLVVCLFFCLFVVFFFVFYFLFFGGFWLGFFFPVFCVWIQFQHLPKWCSGNVLLWRVTSDKSWWIPKDSFSYSFHRWDSVRSALRTSSLKIADCSNSFKQSD